MTPKDITDSSTCWLNKINGEISIWISRNTHVVWLSKRLIASCTLYTGWIRREILLASHEATGKLYFVKGGRGKSLRRKSCLSLRAWGYGHAKFLGEFKIQKYCTRQMLLFNFLIIIISCGSEAVFHADMSTKLKLFHLLWQWSWINKAIN